MEVVGITGIGSELQGVGRLRDGRAAFVPFSIPGEVVEVEIARDCGRYVEARAVRIVEPSPARVEPDCPVYGLCGGCQARHMAYAESLVWKRRRVEDALRRLGGFENPDVRPTIGVRDPLRARNKAEYAIQDGVIGAFRPGSREVVPLSDCLLQRPESAAALKQLSRMNLAGLRFAVTRVNRGGEMMLTLSGDGGRPPFSAFPGAKSLYCCKLRPRPRHALDGECRHISGAERLEEALLGLRFSLHPQSFFQVNAEQAERMYTIALDALELRGDEAVLDAYAGAGTITLAAAQRAKAAVGVEISKPAVDDAKESARRNGLADRARFVLGDAAVEIPKLAKGGMRFDAAILDPPRRGADASVLGELIRLSPARVAYVSCDPGTLARDLKRLCEGGYALQWAQPVDMFAYTGHVETVAFMTWA